MVTRYVILADTNKIGFETPRQLVEINGERLIERTIRLLKENGINDIIITSHDKRFDGLGVKRYEPLHNEYDPINNKGYWLNCFTIELLDQPVTFLFGDCYYSENAIKTIVETDTNSTLYFCTQDNKDTNYAKEYDEAFAYKVVDYELFKKKIEEVKQMYDEGKCDRNPIVWELYRHIHNEDINWHKMTTDYVAINDESCDIDDIEDIEKLRRKIEK